VGLLGAGTRFQGNIRFQGTLRIDGVVNGTITAKPGSGAVLIINRGGEVDGNVVSDSVMIGGRLKGNIQAVDRVEIYRHGDLLGDIITDKIMIQEGARFRGQISMRHKPEAKAGSPLDKPMVKAEAKPEVKPEAQPHPA